MAQSLVFNVIRGSPELITPARPTPYELKELSDIDDQTSLRFQIPMIYIYRNNGEHYGRSVPRGRDPAKVIKEAVAKALVPYYPFAGRLREKKGGKLVVECNGEGIIFIEADANITLKEFGDVTDFVPPFPLEKLLLFDDMPGSNGVLDTSLIFMQVTRFKCGGFILALRFNHTMADASGLALLLNTIAEFAHGAHSPRIQPVWMRHLLSARNPPQVTCEHPEYEVDTNIMTFDDMVEKSFFFGPTEIANLKRHIPPNKTATTFEIITASIWKCRIMALQLDPKELVRYICIVNSRFIFNSFIPSGYYGNAIALPISISTASKLTTNPLEYAIDLVKQAKAKVTLEYMQSITDFMVLNGRPPFNAANSFLVSDTTRARFDRLDFGWGLPVYSGPAKGGIDPVPGAVGFYVTFKNEKGEKGFVVPMSLPRKAMDIFVKELNKLVNEVPKYPPTMKHILSSI